MSKETKTIQEFINSIRISVKSGTIEKDYPDLLMRCRGLGLSSYFLTLLIKKAKEDKDSSTQTLLDSSFFVIKQNSEDNKQPLVEDFKKGKKNSKISMILLFALCCIEGFLLLYLHLDKKDLMREYSASTAKKSSFHSALTKIYNLTQNLEYTQSFSGWRSDNHSDNSKSQTNYYIDASKGDILTFNCFTNSEKFDSLRITLSSENNNTISQEKSLLKASEETNRSVLYIFNETGRYKLHVEYEKDGSVSKYNDNASISNIYLHKSQADLIDSIHKISNISTY